MATSVCRRWARAGRWGSSSSAWWVSGMLPSARPDSTGAMDGLASQRIAVTGCSAAAISRRSACRPGGSEPLSGPISSSSRGADEAAGALAGAGMIRGRCRRGSRPRAAAGCSRRRAGCARVPEAIASWRPQAEQAARRRWQAGHHGFPVAREIPHGAGLAADGAGQDGERGAAGAQRPVRGPPVDPAAAPAAGAGFQVRPGR